MNKEKLTVRVKGRNKEKGGRAPTASGAPSPVTFGIHGAGERTGSGKASLWPLAGQLLPQTEILVHHSDRIDLTAHEVCFVCAVFFHTSQ